MNSRPIPISVQLYSLRDESSKDFDAVLKNIADIGYLGVEPFNLYGKKPDRFAQQVRDLGMQVSSSHYPWANHTDVSEVIDVVKAMGLQRAAGGFGPQDFTTGDSLKRTVEKVNALVERLKQADLQLFLHNHWFEFVPIDGEIPYHTLQRECPDVLFEVDTYWAANFGACDPIEEVARIRHRAPLLHIKDGPLQREKAHVAVGQGAMDIGGIVQAADCNVLEWLIVELDDCDTDMLQAVAESYTYLTENDFAQGAKQ